MCMGEPGSKSRGLTLLEMCWDVFAQCCFHPECCLKMRFVVRKNSCCMELSFFCSLLLKLQLAGAPEHRAQELRTFSHKSIFWL